MNMGACGVQWNAKEPLQLEVYTSWDALVDLCTAWEQLLLNSYGPTIFSTPEWLGAWWKTYGKDKRLLTVALSNSQGELVGLAPFSLEELDTQLHGRIRRLRLVGDGDPSDNLDLIFRSGQEEACSNALLSWLACNPVWDICELNTLPSDSPSIYPLLGGIKKRRWVYGSYGRPNSAIVLPGSWELYLKQLPKEHARGVERYTRRLYRHYAVRTVKCTNEGELPNYLEVLFDLHQRRWNSQGEPGSFASPEPRQFYFDMSWAFLRRGWLEFWLLELNGAVAAAQFALRYGDTVYQLQEGLDPEHYSDRAGHVLRAHVIEQLIAEGVHRYDYLGGSEPHKQNWGAQSGTYTDIHFAKPYTRGNLYLHTRDCTEAARLWLHANAPRAAYSILRDIYHAVHRR